MEKQTQIALLRRANPIEQSHENPHRGFFGSLLEALVAMDANIDLIKCSKT